MGGPTKIEWTDRTWNPTRGCTRVSEGCRNCYAERVATRFAGEGLPYEGLATGFGNAARWTGKLAFSETALLEPLKRRKPTTYFVNSMSDLFHEKMPREWIDRVFAVMAICPQHTFQVLTKRPERMRAYLEGADVLPRLIAALQRIDRETPNGKHSRDPNIGISWNAWAAAENLKLGNAKSSWPHFPFSNVWLGTSCEDQATADARIPDLLATPAAVRFVSAEPLLGPIDLSEWIKRVDHCGACGAECDRQEADRCPSCGAENHLISTWGFDQAERYRTGERYDESSVQGRADIAGTNSTLDWIIVGGEGGPQARPMHPAWARSIRDQCAEAGVPYLFKQWGEWLPWSQFEGAGIDDGAEQTRFRTSELEKRPLAGRRLSDVVRRDRRECR